MIYLRIYVRMRWCMCVKNIASRSCKLGLLRLSSCVNQHITFFACCVKRHTNSCCRSICSRNNCSRESRFHFSRQFSRRSFSFTATKMTNIVQYVSTSDRGLTKEIEISVPWGIVAGKTLGDPKNPPVLCIHGWLDNCNTFDKLIPLLLQNKFYVFIDLPGHGLSSGINLGNFYSTFDYIALVERISNHFNWPTFSFLSHSLGGNISAIYSGTFPEKVDKLMLIDVLGAHVPIPGSEAKTLRSAIESYAKYEQQLYQPPRAFSYEDAKKRLMNANKSLTNEAADILLERGTSKNEDGSFVFVRDVRHNYRNTPGVSAAGAYTFLTNIRAETMHILAEDGITTRIPEDRKEIFESLVNDGFNACDFHKRVQVGGKHHVHLCNPENLIEHINLMLQRPPRTGLNQPTQAPQTSL